MLVQFRAENHRSLRDEQVLSLVAADGLGADPRLIDVEGLSEALLPAVVIYGANASGKTNVLHALAFMHSAVRNSHRRWEPGKPPPRNPFALSEKSSEPCLYEADIVLGGVHYRYGFVLGTESIAEEWLYAWSADEKQLWFEREGQRFTFGKHLSGDNETIRGVTRDNSLFLSAAAQNNHAQISRVFMWFQSAHFELQRGWDRLRSSERILELYREEGQFELFESEEARTGRSITRLLRAADVGILNLGAIKDQRGRAELQFLHKTADQKGAWLPLEAESAGTITLLGIAAQVINVLRRGGLLCIDELEASLHPTLALELLRMFHDHTHNPRGAQLVVSTHDTNLLGDVMGEPPLRRDQIWFTEKDDSGATHLYPLTDFQPQAHENLERGYLQGRYGAIPFLGTLVAADDEL